MEYVVPQYAGLSGVANAWLVANMHI